MTRAHILAEISMERERQDVKFGVRDHPDGPSAVGLGIPPEWEAKLTLKYAEENGTLGWGHILSEEVSEAVAAIGNDEALKAELIQVAAVAVAWIEAIERRNDPGPIQPRLAPKYIDRPAPTKVVRDSAPWPADPIDVSDGPVFTPDWSAA